MQAVQLLQDGPPTPAASPRSPEHGGGSSRQPGTLAELDRAAGVLNQPAGPVPAS